MQSCDYRNVSSSKIEDMMLLKVDNKTHQPLVTLEVDLPLDSLSPIFHNHDTVARGLTHLQITPTNSMYDVPINTTKPACPNTGRCRSATVVGIGTCNRWGVNTDTPTAIFARGTVTLRRCVVPKEHNQSKARVHAADGNTLMMMELSTAFNKKGNLTDPRMK